MADILYTTKSGTDGYTGVTTDTWFQIIDERNNMAVDFAESGAPQITTNEFAPKDNRDELLTTIGYAQNTAAIAFEKAGTIEQTYIAPKSIYTIDGDAGGETYNLDETYDRIYLKNSTVGETYSEIILPSLDYFKDDQKLVLVSHPDSNFKARISWFDGNGTKNYIDAVISKDNDLELDYWEGVGDMVIRGSYSGYTFDENMFIGYVDNELTYSFEKLTKTGTQIYSKNLTTGSTNEIVTDKYGNVYVGQAISGDTIVKLDQAGNKVWGLVLGTEVKAMAIKDGFLYIGGTTFETEYGNANLAAYDLDGTFLWGSNYDGTVEDLAVTNDGEYLYVVGTPNTIETIKNAIKIYTTIDGAISGEVDDLERATINAISIAPNDNIIVGGIISSGTTYSVYSSDFTRLFSNFYGSTIVYDIISNDDAFYACGDYVSGATIVIKSDYDNNILVEEEYGADLYKMSFDAAGNVYAVGDIGAESIIGAIYDKDLVKLDDIAGTVDARSIHVK